MAKGVKHLILVDATWRFAREMAAVLREKERVQFAHNFSWSDRKEEVQ